MHSDAQLGQYIPLHYHYQMLLDEARMRGFAQAIAYNVLEGARVLELGGGTGVLSCFAARQGARVWCVERQPELAETARRLLEDNGVGDRVEVVTADVGQYLPPEPVDFVICEMLHSALLREKQIQIIDDFKRRYLEVYESCRASSPRLLCWASNRSSTTSIFSATTPPYPSSKIPRIPSRIRFPWAIQPTTPSSITPASSRASYASPASCP